MSFNPRRSVSFYKEIPPWGFYFDTSLVNGAFGQVIKWSRSYQLLPFPPLHHGPSHLQTLRKSLNFTKYLFLSLSKKAIKINSINSYSWLWVVFISCYFLKEIPYHLFGFCFFPLLILFSRLENPMPNWKNKIK